MTTTKIRSTLTTIALAAAVAPGVAAAAQAGAAQAPEVGKQQTIAAGKASPIDIPGTSVKKGTTLKKNQKIVFRTVEVQPGDTARFTLSCGSGSVHRGLAPSEGGPIFNLAQKRSDYVGTRVVKLRADGKAGRNTRGTMYALCSR
ncbi:hypothetical protein [Paraconexibacter algicola]|uniref:Uncharacterized protein n=1 Tax=Paraconexibacter algicola TaxID=2133960 RepID=A0A2T4UFA5_9ACTN|nr:hypothetical protein [Paraconexibacter algicola]PTL56448.1 hypothetical protein C7Y72_15925 [Paraconexibacter algicola]